MKVKENNNSTLVWFKIIVLFDIVYILLPPLTFWAYELSNYFEDNYAAILEFNNKELTLFQSILQISHQDLPQISFLLSKPLKSIFGSIFY